MERLDFEAYGILEKIYKKFPVEEVLKEILKKEKNLSEIYIDNYESPEFLFGVYKKREFILIGDICKIQDIKFVEWKIREYKLTLGNVYNKNLLDFFLKNTSISIFFDERYQLTLEQFNYFENKNLNIVPINFDIAQKITEEIDKDFEVAWNSPMDFFEKGAFGYCLVENNKIISIAWAYFISENKVEIAVKTLEKYRGRGLSAYVTSAMIKSSLERNINPYWGCNKSNVPSIKLGEKLGFKIKNEYYWIYPQV